MQGGSVYGGGGGVRQRKVVINRLRNVDVADSIARGLKELGDPVGCGGGVVSTHGDEKLNIVVLEKGQVEILLEILVSRLEAAHLEVGSTPVEVGVSLEEIDVFGAGVLTEESGVAFVKSDDPVAVGKESLGD